MLSLHDFFCSGKPLDDSLRRVSGRKQANTMPSARTTVLSQNGIHGLLRIKAALRGVARVSESSAVPVR